MAAAPVNIDMFGAALADNKCCLFNEKTQQKKDVGSFDGATTTTTSNAPSDTIWSTRNIVLLSLVAVVLAFALWALTKYAMQVKKQKVMF